MNGKPISNCYWVPGSTLCAGEYPGHYSRRFARAKLGNFLDAGIEVFIDLTRDDDPLDPYDDVLAEEALERNMDVTYQRMPIEDMGVTTPRHMSEILDVIDSHLSQGRKVYVHCWGGVGRTGTTVGCFLVRHGLDGQTALDEVRRLFRTMSPDKVELHPESPQTPAQRDMVRNWFEPSPDGYE